MRGCVLSFTRNMASLLEAGLNVSSSLAVCVEADANTARIAGYLRGKIMEGESLYDATGGYNSEVRNEFSGLYRALVKIGERSGKTEQVFSKLAEYLEKREEIRKKTLQALVYPSAVLVMTLFACVFAAVFVRPRIYEIAEILSAGKDIQARHDVGGKIMSWLVASLAVLGAVAVLVSRKCSDSARYLQDKIVMRLPVISKMIGGEETKNFCFAVSLMTAGGVPVTEALRESVLSAGNGYYAACLSEFTDSITEGMSFSDAAEKCPVFPPFVRTWLSIGERTGNIEKSFSEIYKYFDIQGEGSRNVLISLLEPFFIVVAGIAVMVFVMKFVVPVFNAIGDI